MMSLSALIAQLQDLQREFPPDVDPEVVTLAEAEEVGVLISEQDKADGIYRVYIEHWA